MKNLIIALCMFVSSSIVMIGDTRAGFGWSPKHQSIGDLQILLESSKTTSGAYLSIQAHNLPFGVTVIYELVRGTNAKIFSDTKSVATAISTETHRNLMVKDGKLMPFEGDINPEWQKRN